MGVLFKLHHAIADGLAAVALIASLFDLQPGAPDPPAEAWTPQAPPPARALLVDSLRTRTAAVASTLRHPLRLGRGVGLALLDSALFLRQWSAAPRTSLNRPLGSARRIRVLHLDLEKLRTAAHAHGARVNDAVLAIVAGGLRQVLVSRGEQVTGVQLRATILVGRRSADAARELGNAAGRRRPRRRPLGSEAGPR
jgi:diacylglycerol O-acyltransferase / wax synthase